MLRHTITATEAVTLEMPVHLLGMLCRTLSNAVHTVYPLSDVIENIFTSRSSGTCGVFEVVTVTTLYKLLT